jgi:putative component of membrane protein insertase Oxa1/YidC/SpoIIIJ protein YidD
VLRCNPWSAGGVDHAHDQTLFRRRAEERHA